MKVENRLAAAVRVGVASENDHKVKLVRLSCGNLHRHGYNGRGGEYFSEDPVLSGYIGSGVIQGAQSKGVLVNIKHAAFNDQEINRSGVAAFTNEQAARELELRNLEQMFVGKGKPASFVADSSKEDTYGHAALGVMTSYNRIGCVASSANRAVTVDIMRGEWGFKGYSVTDFTGAARSCPLTAIWEGGALSPRSAASFQFISRCRWCRCRWCRCRWTRPPRPRRPR